MTAPRIQVRKIEEHRADSRSDYRLTDKIEAVYEISIDGTSVGFVESLWGIDNTGERDRIERYWRPLSIDQRTITGNGGAGGGWEYTRTEAIARLLTHLGY